MTRSHHKGNEVVFTQKGDSAPLLKRGGRGGRQLSLKSANGELGKTTKNQNVSFIGERPNKRYC